MCGLEVDVDGERVTAVRPDDAGVWSRGFVCPKGAMLGARHHDPDRIRTPLVREGERWREVGWDAGVETRNRASAIASPAGAASACAGR